MKFHACGRLRLGEDRFKMILSQLRKGVVLFFDFRQALAETLEREMCLNALRSAGCRARRHDYTDILAACPYLVA
jgi:hypothetical protein